MMVLSNNQWVPICRQIDFHSLNFTHIIWLLKPRGQELKDLQTRCILPVALTTSTPIYELDLTPGPQGRNLNSTMEFTRYKPTLERQIVASLPEHQVLFSFNDDEDVERFEIWWAREGLNKFLDWQDDNRKHETN